MTSRALHPSNRRQPAHLPGAGRLLGGAALLLAAGGGVLVVAPAVASASLPAATAGPQSPIGTVRSVDAGNDTFVLSTGSGASITVTVTKTTIYKLGSGGGVFADVKVGKSVAVIGTGSPTSVTASIVVVGHASPAGPGGGGPGGGSGPGPRPGGGFGPGLGTVGTVASVDPAAGTFVLREFSGSSVTVKVTSSTTYRDRAERGADFAAIKSGIRVAVAGTSANGTETATSVIILGTGPRPGRAFGPGGTVGTVTSVDSVAKTFVVKQPDGSSTTVKVTASTIYRDAEKASASFADVTKGATVMVQGTRSSASETATVVRIGVFPPPRGAAPAA